jgi:hypothetical protein
VVPSNAPRTVCLILPGIEEKAPRQHHARIGYPQMLGSIWTTAECLDTIGFKGALEMPGTGLDGMTVVEFTDPGQRLCLVNRPAVGEVVLYMRTISVCSAICSVRA